MPPWSWGVHRTRRPVSGAEAGAERADILAAVTSFVTGGAGFLLAVLWFDLMFDVQVLGRGGDLPEDVLGSISAYYRRVTTSARPMNRLVGAAMLATIASVCL